ncbi:MAG TPA: hypothetical protein VIT38_12360 [Allosphingosinicella sp.]
MRKFLGSLVGVIVAIAVQTAGDLLGNKLYPPHITDMWNRSQVAEALAMRPTAALWISVAGYFAGALIGGWIGKKIARSPVGAWVPAGLLALMALAVGWGFPGAAWAMVATVAAPLIGGLLANHLAGAVPAAEPAAVDAGPADAVEVADEG